MSKPFTPIQLALRSCASPERATVSKQFFKTGPGEYGQGDQFLGVTVPDTRKVAKYPYEQNFCRIFLQFCQSPSPLATRT